MIERHALLSRGTAAGSTARSLLSEPTGALLSEEFLCCIRPVFAVREGRGIRGGGAAVDREAEDGVFDIKADRFHPCTTVVVLDSRDGNT